MKVERIALLILLLFASPGARAADSLILYDSTGQYGWIGQLHAKMLANLLGHFPLSAEIKPVEQYSAGDIGSVQHVFYIGTVYDNAIPAAFLREVMSTAKPVCWMRYNLWQLTANSEFRAQFKAKFGFRFDALDSSGYSNVIYKGETFSKDIADTELGRVIILNSNMAQVPAEAGNTSARIPYVVHSSNFWYIADAPFTFLSEEDRYLVFADLLHDIVGIPHTESHRALIRLEDIDPTYSPELLREVADFLASENVPFAVAVVPVYADPLGVYNYGVSESYAISEVPEFVEALQYMASKGGQVLMHGYTHQYNSVVNPYSGTTGDDYEFFRVATDAGGNVVDYYPVVEDSRAWAQGRVEAGLTEFRLAGLTPVGWETPHYTASAIDYSVFAGTFSLTMQRVLYFDDQGRSAGQFFPYPIERDIYGQKIMPENLGNIDTNSWNGYPARLPEDLIRAARKNRVLRDAWAGAYFHPWLGLGYLTDLVHGIKGLGYTYVALANEAPPVIMKQPKSVTSFNGKPVSLSVEAEGAVPLSYQWRLNGGNISGATNATLTLTNGQNAFAGLCSVTISNSAGRVTSLSASVNRFAITNWIVGTTVKFSFQTETGSRYVLESCANLAVQEWRSITNVNGNGAVAELQEPASLNTNCFYRVRVE